MPSSRFAFAMLIVPLLTTGVLAQGTLSESEIRRNILQLRIQAADAEKNINEYTDRMIELDRRIETSVESVLGMLTSVGDSTDSRTLVTRTKEDTLAGLRESLEFYAKQRDDSRSELFSRTRSLTVDQLEENIAVMDKRVDKRIDQIVRLANSLTGHKEYRKYETVQHGRRGRVDQVRSEEWVRNREVAAKSARNTEGLARDLRESITRLNKHNENWKKVLAGPVTAKERARVEQEMADNDARIASRQKQLDSLLSGRHQTKNIARSEARSLTRLIDEEREKIRADWTELTNLKNMYDSNRTNLRSFQHRITISEEQLARVNPAEQPASPGP